MRMHMHMHVQDLLVSELQAVVVALSPGLRHLSVSDCWLLGGEDMVRLQVRGGEVRVPPGHCLLRVI